MLVLIPAGHAVSDDGSASAPRVPSPSPRRLPNRALRYRHWTLSFDGPIATLGMNVAEDGGIRPGYKLKLNSYDLGVDLELADAAQPHSIRAPGGAHGRASPACASAIFCSGANIFMLGLSSHAWKVNFCKFTNETRNGIEDASRHSELKFLAAMNGSCAGGGYELALACDEIWLVDDRSSAISFPEIPLLGVLPGTGGLTRLVDKRKVRRDLADVFCTTAEGVRGDRAKEWRLVDEIVKPSEFDAEVRERARDLAKASDRPTDGARRGADAAPAGDEHDRLDYEHVTVEIDHRRHARQVHGPRPASSRAHEIDGDLAAGADWWPLAMARELDDAHPLLRTNEPDIGTWLLRTQGRR